MNVYCYDHQHRTGVREMREMRVNQIRIFKPILACGGQLFCECSLSHETDKDCDWYDAWNEDDEVIAELPA